MRRTKEDKKKQILTAAMKVFSQKGYHKSRMEEIAMEAGIGKGTIYEYFPSKIQLFQAMIDQGFDAYFSKMKVEKMQSLPFSEWLRILTESHMRFCLDNKDITQILFMEKAAPDAELMQWAIDKRNKKLRFMQTMISKGMDKNEIRSVDPQLLSYIIETSMMSFYIPIVMEGRKAQPESFARQYVDILMNGIGNTKE